MIQVEVQFPHMNSAVDFYRWLRLEDVSYKCEHGDGVAEVFRFEVDDAEKALLWLRGRGLEPRR